MHKCETNIRSRMADSDTLIARGSLLLVLAMYLLLGGLPARGSEVNIVCVVPEERLKNSPSCISLREVPSALRRLAATNQSGRSISVRIAEGEYRLTEPLRIDGTVWKGAGGKLSIEGAGVGRTMISGTQTIDLASAPLAESIGGSRAGIRKISLANYPIARREKITSRTFGKYVAPDFELFVAGKRLPRARYPQSGYLRIGKNADASHLAIAGVDARDYTAEPALMAGGYFYHDWADEAFGISAEPALGSFLFPDGKPTYGVRPGQRIWLENAIRDIRAPGDWAFDPKSQTLWILPPKTSEAIEISVAQSGLILSGVRDVSVSGIEFFGFLNSGLLVEKSLDVTIDSITVSNVGGSAFRLEGRGIAARNVVATDTGSSGVAINGGNRKTLDPGRVSIENCRIERVGRLVRSYAAAVGLNGVGNVVRNCVMADGPHAAIVFHGNEHLIEGNLIERFLTESDDAGAIYTGRDWTERGTTIRGNILRNLGGAEGKYGNNAIYLDDQAGGIRVEGNLIHGANRCVMIGGGRDNEILDNVFSGCKEGIYIDDRGNREIARRGSEANMVFKRQYQAIAAGSEIYAKRYPTLKENGNTGNNAARGNVFLNTLSEVRSIDNAASALSISASVSLRGDNPGVAQLRDSRQINAMRQALISGSTSSK